MRLVLKQFQEDAVTKLVRGLRGAARDAGAGDLQSVCLASTTGSGKTVMITRAIELILGGDEGEAPVRDATFLWVTDQPELNEQTRRKMAQTSSLLSPDDLRVIDIDFDQETFDPGSINFLNIQKIGKEKGLVTAGDLRTFTIWDTVRNTAAARPTKFFVVIDEAHRGMVESERGQLEATSILQKFIKGSPGEISPVPIVVGISATPDRFNRLIAGQSRQHRPVDVDVEEVRESGLIKDVIVIHHPRETQPADITLLREAARTLKSFDSRWASYCASQDEVPLTPLLVIQVQDARSKGQVSETDLGEAFKVLHEELGPVPPDTFAHAFQEGTEISVGSGSLRYLAPADIEGDPNVRVIFFKTSLNTGWDCPRAEVIMSFRPATDATNIAQLVGRMVRTPLARRVIEDDVLNSVSLFLPHYDRASLSKVIAKLVKPDDGGMPIAVEESDDIVELSRRQGSDELFEALSRLPSYIVPRQRKASQIRRLMKLARHLTNDGIDINALPSAKTVLLDILDSEFERKKLSASFQQIVQKKGHIEVDIVNWNVGTDVFHAGESVGLDISQENVEDLFEAAGRKLNEGLHKVWWRRRANSSSQEREVIKLELFALCVDPEVTRKLENAAQQLVQKWLGEHRDAIGNLEEGSQASYTEIRNLAATPELAPILYPLNINGRRSATVWEKHLYVEGSGKFPSQLNRSESDIVSASIAEDEVVAWLRNSDRKTWSLCVPYLVDGEERAMYPDFLFLRKRGEKILVDLIEPHTISLADAPAKAAGLARFAAQHADKFGRILLVMIDGDISRSFDLCDEITRNKIRAIQLPAQMRQLMQTG